MKKFLLLILLTFIFAIPTESDSVVSSLEIDPEEHLRKTISKEDWDQVRPFLMRKFRDFLNSPAEDSEKKSVEIPSTIWIKKHTTPDKIAKEANPSLGTLQQKVPSSHLSIVVPNNLPERTASIETKRPAIQPQVESRVEDEVMKSALDKYKGRGQFIYDWKSWDKKVSDHLSGVASSKAKKTRKRPTSQNWDFFLQLLEADRDKKDPYNPPIASTVLRPAPSNRQIPKNTGRFGKVSPLDDEMMKSIPGDHQDLSHLNLDSDSTFSPLFWKNWDDHVPGSELSAVSPVSLKDNPPKTMSEEDEELMKQLLENFVLNEERDQYVKHLETDHTTHSSVPSTSQHVLEEQSALQSVSNHRRIKNAGEMGKIMSKDNPSISISKKISKDLASSKAKEIFAKLPRIIYIKVQI